MVILRACVVCGTPSSGRRCPRHAKVAGSWSPRRRAVVTSGWAQQRRARAVLARAGHRCYLCGGEATIADHKVPLAEGGADDMRNMAAICAPCHKRKIAAESRRGRERAEGGER